MRRLQHFSNLSHCWFVFVDSPAWSNGSQARSTDAHPPSCISMKTLLESSRTLSSMVLSSSAYRFQAFDNVQCFGALSHPL